MASVRDDEIRPMVDAGASEGGESSSRRDAGGDADAAPVARKPYRTPELRCLGDVAQLTFASAKGNAASDGAFTKLASGGH